MDYVQCRLKKDDTWQVAWIEDRKIKVGNQVSLKEDDTIG